MTKINKNCNVGDVVRIVFDDHSEGSQHIVFEVFGRCLKKDRRSILVGCWKYADNDEYDENMTCYTILRAGIKSVEILVPKEPQECPKKAKSDKTDKSPRRRANSADGREAKVKPESADITPHDPPDSQGSNITTSAQNTTQTSI